MRHAINWNRIHFVFQFSVFLLGALYLSSLLLPAATFVWDDYRYLRIVKECGEALQCSLRRGSVVVNEWPDVWWVSSHEGVSFFRPFVIVSFLWDWFLWGLDPKGYVATNILLHLLCAAAGLRVGYRLGLTPAVLTGATTVFLLHSVHIESILYIAGRTDLMAALSALLTVNSFLRDHADGRRGPSAVSLGWYFAALAAKEYNVILPLMILLVESYKPGRQAWLYSLPRFLLPLALFLGLRAISLSGFPNSLPYPYFNLPWHPHFFDRLVATMLQYMVALGTGNYLLPFIEGRRALFSMFGPADITLSLFTFLACILVAARRTSARRALLAMLVLLLPNLFLYSSARYLYLPSVIYVALFALAVHYLVAARALVTACVLILLGGALPALHLSDIAESQPYSAPSEEEWVSALLGELSSVPVSQPLILADFPADWVSYQFLGDYLQVTTGTHRPIAFVSVSSSGSTSGCVTEMGSLKFYRVGEPLYTLRNRNDLLPSHSLSDTVRCRSGICFQRALPEGILVSTVKPMPVTFLRWDADPKVWRSERLGSCDTL